MAVMTHTEQLLTALENTVLEESSGVYVSAWQDHAVPLYNNAALFPETPHL